jgi:hypothetical protein
VRLAGESLVEALREAGITPAHPTMRRDPEVIAFTLPSNAT